MTAPNNLELELIEKFRSNVEDVLSTDEQKSASFLIRWIRARDGDLEKAEDILRRSLEWRAEEKVDLVLQLPGNPYIRREFPFWVDSRDKAGRPVVEMPLGSWDIRKATTTADLETDFQTYTAYFFESIMDKIREGNEKANLGKDDWPNTEWVGVIDFKNYSYAQFLHLKALKKLLNYAATFEMHYPETLHKVYFINTPAVFPLFMALLKKIIAPKTVGKIQCISEEKDWKPILLEEIDESELGHLYGGKKVRSVDGEVYNYPV